MLRFPLLVILVRLLSSGCHCVNCVCGGEQGSDLTLNNTVQPTFEMTLGPNHVDHVFSDLGKNGFELSGVVKYGAVSLNYSFNFNTQLTLVIGASESFFERCNEILERWEYVKSAVFGHEPLFSSSAKKGRGNLGLVFLGNAGLFDVGFSAENPGVNGGETSIFPGEYGGLVPFNGGHDERGVL